MSTNDHEIKIGSTTKKLKLIRDDSGAALYSVIEEIPPHQSQLRFTQDNWIGGHGQYDFKEDDVYFEGQSIDTTQDGRVFLGPLIYTVGSGGNGCFVGGTLVSTLTGGIPIEQIKVGDIVISYNESIGELELNIVGQTFIHTEEEAEDYYLRINEMVGVTPNHPFYVNGEWKEARELQIGDTLLGIESGEVCIDSIQKVYEKVATYNLEVGGSHNYFADGFLVHNKCPRIFTYNGEDYVFDALINVEYVGKENDKLFKWPLKHIKEPKIRVDYDPFEINYIDFIKLIVTDRSESDIKAFYLSPISISCTSEFDCDLSLLKDMDNEYIISSKDYNKEIFLTFEDFPELEAGYKRKIEIFSSGYQIVLEPPQPECEYIEEFLKEYWACAKCNDIICKRGGNG